MARFFIGAMLLLQAGASTAYFCDGDWRRGLYWVGAVVITVSVTI